MPEVMNVIERNLCICYWVKRLHGATKQECWEEVAQLKPKLKASFDNPRSYMHVEDYQTSFDHLSYEDAITEQERMAKESPYYDPVSDRLKIPKIERTYTDYDTN